MTSEVRIERPTERGAATPESGLAGSVVVTLREDRRADEGKLPPGSRAAGTNRLPVAVYRRRRPAATTGSGNRSA